MYLIKNLPQQLQKCFIFRFNILHRRVGPLLGLLLICSKYKGGEVLLSTRTNPQVSGRNKISGLASLYK
jgi:hypothetical protein